MKCHLFQDADNGEVLLDVGLGGGQGLLRTKQVALRALKSSYHELESSCIYSKQSGWNVFFSDGLNPQVEMVKVILFNTQSTLLIV